MFDDRLEAGVTLAKHLEKYKKDNPLVLAIPRGGLVTAYETIKSYGYEWDLINPRKISAPQNEEVAIGAVICDGTHFIDDDTIKKLNISQDKLNDLISEQVKEINRRTLLYKNNTDFPKVKGRTVIIIDDGIATGYTIKAAIHAINEKKAKKIIVAVPVAPQEIILDLEEIVDEVISLIVPNNFYAVGQFYDHFEQTSDDEVLNLINELNHKEKH